MYRVLVRKPEERDHLEGQALMGGLYEDGCSGIGMWRRGLDRFG